MNTRARARVFILSVLSISPLPLAAQPTTGTQPVTHEALWLMKRVGSPVLSPDGKWVVTSVAEPSYDEKKETSDLWIVPADGSAPPRRLTSSKAAESGADWSPDSRRLAFTTKREDDDVAQVYVLDVAGGGEARRVTSAPLAARAPRWSPDGKSILYQSAVYPGAADAEANKKIAAERKDPKSKVRIYDVFPIRRWDKWLDDTQTHLFVVPVDGDSKARDLLAGTALVAQPGFGAPGGEGSGEDFAPAWTPDGSAAVFVATTNRTSAAYEEVATHLYQVPVGGGEPAALTTAEIVRVDPALKKQSSLTSFTTDAASRLGWAPLQEFWFDNDKGRRVHSFVVLPPAFDAAKKYPLFVLIHGGHANMWRDQITLRWNYHLLASPGYVVLLTDYRGSTGYGEAFTLDIQGDPLRGPGNDLNRAADEAIKRFPYIDASRQAAGGASYGGHLSNWLEATTTRYKASLSHAGLSSLQTQWGTSDGIYKPEAMMGGPFWTDTKKGLDQSP